MARFIRCMVCACVLLALALPGCALWAKTQGAAVGLNYPHTWGETFAQSPRERYQNVSRVAAYDARAIVEDLDLLFLTDRPTRLTRWHDR